MPEAKLHAARKALDARVKKLTDQSKKLQKKERKEEEQNAKYENKRKEKELEKKEAKKRDHREQQRDRTTPPLNRIVNVRDLKRARAILEKRLKELVPAEEQRSKKKRKDKKKRKKKDSRNRRNSSDSESEEPDTDQDEDVEDEQGGKEDNARYPNLTEELPKRDSVAYNLSNAFQRGPSLKPSPSSNINGGAKPDTEQPRQRHSSKSPARSWFPF